MAKKQKKKKDEKPAEINYGTKLEWVRCKVSPTRIDGEILTDVVVCEDEKGHYATRMTYVCANVLDPYRMYRRNQLLNEEEIKLLLEIEENSKKEEKKDEQGEQESAQG